MRTRNVKEAAVLASTRQNGAALSEGEKWGIITCIKQGLTQRAVAAEFDVSRKVVGKYWRRFNATGGVARQPGSGRKPILDSAAEDHVLKLVTGSDSPSATDVSKQLHVEGVTTRAVHRNTIIRAAQRAAGRAREKLWVQRGKPAKAMTADTKKKRLAFALANQHTDWKLVLFTDRKKFHLRYPGSKVKQCRWVLGLAIDSEAAAYMPTKPMCYNIYAGMCVHGVTVAHSVAGTSKHTDQHFNKKGQLAKNITESEFKVVVLDTLLPEGRRLFTTQGVSTWTLQMDNDPSHNIAPTVVKKYNKANSSSVQQLVNWPPNSPDLNPIENLWAWLQARVDEKGCSSFEEFKAAVDAELAAVPKDHLANLVASMKKRMNLVVQRGGGPTGY